MFSSTVQKAVVEDGDRHPSYNTSYTTASASKNPNRQRFGLFGGTLAIAILIAASVVHRERTDPQQLPAGTTAAGRPAVTGGSFRLPQDFATEACALIEAQFVSDTDCQCSLSEQQSSAVMYGCRHAAMSCREHEHHVRGESDGVCATLTYAGEVSLDRPVVLASSLSTSEFCLQSLHIGMERLGDLCVRLVRGGGGAIGQEEESNGGAAAAATSSLLEQCRASVDNRMCRCTVCGGGVGIELDCSMNPNGGNAVSTQCDEVGLLSAIKGEPHSVIDFLPSFHKQQ